MRRWSGAAALAAAVVAVGGCGDGGPKRDRLSGAVTYDGRPIPFGDVVFTPDGAKKNSGPQGFAQIRDGRYDTSRGADGKGVGSGPMIVRVSGFSGPGGTLLCEVDIPLDVPAGGGTLDIAVPKQQKAPAASKQADI